VSERKGRQPAKATETAIEALTPEVKEDNVNVELSDHIMERLSAAIREEVTQAVSPLHQRISDLEQQVQDLNMLSMQPEGAVTFQPVQSDDTPWYQPPGGV
jgi:glucose-6-phosphate isomerase